MGKSQTEKKESKQKRVSAEDFKKALSIFKYVLPYRWAFVLGMIFLVVGSLLFLVIMKIPGEMINIISGKSTYDIGLNQLFTILLILLALQSVFSYFRVQLFAIVSEKSMALLRTDLYKRLIALPILFYEERRVGEITSRITNDVTQVQGVFSITLAEFIRQLILLVGGLIIIIYTMSDLALTTLFTFPVVVVIAMFFGRYIRRLMKKRQDQLAKTNVIVEETMQSIQTVKAYTNEWFEIGRYGKNLTEAVRISLSTARMRGLFASFIIFVMFGSLFFIMWQAALMVQAGGMEEGDLFDFIAFTAIIGGAIASLGNFYTQIVSAIGATDRIFEILDMTPELNPEDTESNVSRFKGDIEYQNVQFSYPTRKDVEVLKSINLSIQAGTKVALVGASGSGKSTIVQLLLRFYELDGGQIQVDGANIDTYDLQNYRKNMAIVPQEVLLFGGTIRENIAYGNPKASEKSLVDAAKKANAWEFIEQFPEGLDTIVGERGIKLSGGQRQRIAIARAILKDPAILLLDEATSSLDAESEKIVQDALNVLMEGRTSIIIAHRLATIREVDCIYVLEQGEIIEQGTHEELSLIENGAYNTLAKLQFEAIP